MAASTRHRRRRRLVTGVICVAMVAGIVGGIVAVIASRKQKATAAPAAASIFKTATVKRGDLTTTETVDGAVQLSATLTVLHRIEGQTSSSLTPASSSNTSNTGNTSNTSNTNNSNNTGNTNTGSSSPLPVNVAAALIDCPATTTPDSTTTTTTTTPDVPTTTAAEDTTSTTTTTPASTTTTTPAPTTTAAVAPCDTTSTAPADTTPAVTTTVDTTPAAAPTGGGASRTGATRSSTGSSASGASSAAGSDGSAARITQTITSIITVDTAIQHGDVLYTVDDTPVVALDGALPAWRTLSTSSSDGADIAQLEASLVALGYDPAQKVTVDDHFDAATRTMVKAWQTGLGIEATGTVPLGSVVFLPAAATVTGVDRAVGDTVGDGDAVLTLATPTQEVLIDVPTGDEAQVVPGLEVKIGQVQGTITRLRSANRNGSVVVEAVIAPAAAIADAGNGSSVKVTVTLQNNTGALIAPAEALVSRLDGTYAVEEQAADGSTKWLTVELLGVSGGNVAIRGDGVSDGTTVLLPA